MSATQQRKTFHAPRSNPISENNLSDAPAGLDSTESSRLLASPLSVHRSVVPRCPSHTGLIVRTRRRSYLLPLALPTLLLLWGCQDSITTPGTLPKPAPRQLALMEVAITGIGSGQVSASASLLTLSGSSGPRLSLSATGQQRRRRCERNPAAGHCRGGPVHHHPDVPGPRRLGDPPYTEH